MNAILPGSSGILIGLVIIFPGVLGAAQWHSESSVKLRGVYDDNINLSTRNQDDVIGKILNGKITSGWRTEISSISLNGGMDLRRYSGQDNQDTNNFNFGIDASHFTERDQFDLGIEVDFGSTLTSEIATSGPTRDSKRRVRTNFAPSWTHLLSERTSSELSYSYTDVEYRDARFTGLSDYTYQSVGVTLTHVLNQKTQAYMSLTSSLYEASDASDTETRDVGVMVGIQQNFSEAFSAGAAAGMRYAKTDFEIAGVDQDTSDSGYLLNANIERSYEQAAISGEFSHSVQPGGQSALLVSDKLTIKADYDMSERLSLHLASNVYRNSSVDEDNSSRDREYFSIQPMARWKMARWWVIEGSYRYRRQKQRSRKSTDSNAVFFSVKHTWPSRPASNKWRE